MGRRADVAGPAWKEVTGGQPGHRPAGRARRWARSWPAWPTRTGSAQPSRRMTAIGAAFLAPDRLAERGLVPSSLTYAPTGERVGSAARLRELRHADPGGLVLIDLLDEDDPSDQALLMRSLTFPGSVVASDAMPVTWTEPPADPLVWPLPGPRSPTRGPPGPSPAPCACSPAVTARSGWPRRCANAAWSQRARARSTCRPCDTRADSSREATPMSWYSTPARSLTAPTIPTALARRPESGTSW